VLSVTCCIQVCARSSVRGRGEAAPAAEGREGEGTARGDDSLHASQPPTCRKWEQAKIEGKERCWQMTA